MEKEKKESRKRNKEPGGMRDRKAWKVQIYEAAQQANLRGNCAAQQIVAVNIPSDQNVTVRV